MTAHYKCLRCGGRGEAALEDPDTTHLELHVLLNMQHQSAAGGCHGPLQVLVRGWDEAQAAKARS